MISSNCETVEYDKDKQYNEFLFYKWTLLDDHRKILNNMIEHIWRINDIGWLLKTTCQFDRSRQKITCQLYVSINE